MSFPLFPSSCVQSFEARAAAAAYINSDSVCEFGGGLVNSHCEDQNAQRASRTKQGALQHCSMAEQEEESTNNA